MLLPVNQVNTIILQLIENQFTT